MHKKETKRFFLYANGVVSGRGRIDGGGAAGLHAELVYMQAADIACVEFLQHDPS